MTTREQVRKKLVGARKRLMRLVAPEPVRAYGELSMVYAAEARAEPSGYLLDVALQAAEAARQITFANIDFRSADAADHVNRWPGEHFRLLAGLVSVLRSRHVVEIGTFSGRSARALEHRLPADGKITTYDLIPWDSFSETALTTQLFASRRVTQVLADLSKPRAFEANRSVLQKARSTPP